MKDNLANYKVPREVVFVDELPRNPTGKVLKRELAEEGEDEDSGSGESDGSPTGRRRRRSRRHVVVLVEDARREDVC